MNRYRITYTGIDESVVLSRVIRATGESKALQLFHVPFQSVKVIPTVHSVKLFASETKAQLFDRYTQNLRKLDTNRYESFLASVEDYWEGEAWAKLSTLLEGVRFFCDDPRVVRDALALQLFANGQDISSGSWNSKPVDVSEDVHAEFEYVAELLNKTHPLPGFYRDARSVIDQALSSLAMGSIRPASWEYEVLSKLDLVADCDEHRVQRSLGKAA